jgi:hypothetical protein
MSRPVAALFLAFVPFVVALPSVAAEPTVDAIVAKHLAARGGVERIRAVQSIRQKGRVSAGAGREGLVTREIARPAKTRFEFTVQGVTSVYYSDGDRGFVVSPFDGAAEPVPLPEEAVAEAAEQADIDGPLLDWKAKGHRVELVGREVVDGREAYALKLTLASGAVRHEFLDAKTLLLVRSVATRRFRGRPVKVTTTFGEFKKTKGLVFPRRIDVEAAGRPNRLRVTVDEIEVQSLAFAPPRE